MSGAVETGSMEQATGTEISPLAGQPAPKEMLLDVARLEREYFKRRPEVSDSNELVIFGTSGHAPFYTWIDAPATPEQKRTLHALSPEDVKEQDLAGEPIRTKLTRAPGNDSFIGGLKVIAESGWFAARPSGTENIYKIYAESFRGQEHLDAIISEAQKIVNHSLERYER